MGASPLLPHFIVISDLSWVMGACVWHTWRSYMAIMHGDHTWRAWLDAQFWPYTPVYGVFVGSEGGYVFGNNQVRSGEPVGPVGPVGPVVAIIRFAAMV